MTDETKKPITVNVNAVCEGYNVGITFELDTLKALPAALKRLRSYGIVPTATDWQRTPEGLPICQKHGVAMQERQKQGDTWYSHKVTTPDGKECYCRGYPNPSANGDDGWNY